MVKKRAVKKSDFEKKLNRVDRNFHAFQRSTRKESQEVEGWVLQRRKFFVRLGWLVALVVVLWIISNIFMKVPGVGI